MQAFLTQLLQNDVLQNLEVFRNGGLMTLRTTLQLDDGTDSLATLVNHLEGSGDVAYLQGIHRLGHLRWQVGQLEARGTHSVLCDIEHQTIVIARVLVV